MLSEIGLDVLELIGRTLARLGQDGLSQGVGDRRTLDRELLTQPAGRGDAESTNVVFADGVVPEDHGDRGSIRGCDRGGKTEDRLARLFLR